MAYDTNALVASVKRRGSVPTTQGLVAQQDFLTIGDEEMQSYVVPLVIDAQSEYMVTEVDQLIAGQTSFRIPTRAVGGKLREVQLVDTLGKFANVPQITVDQLNAVTFGFYLKGNTLNLWNNLQPLNSAWITLRMSYYTRPNSLVYPTAAGTIQSIAGNSVTLTGAPPATFTSSATYDLVRASPGFECLATDSSATVAGSTITFSSAPSSDLRAGDYVCLAGQSPVPQIPLELHSLLAQAVAVKVFQVVCDFDGMQAAQQVLAKMEEQARDLIANRVDGESLRIVNRSSLFRTMW